MATTFQTPYATNGFDFDYRTPPHTPASGGYAYYSPRQYVHASTPSKGHMRRATGDGSTYTYTYTATTPRKDTRYAPATPHHPTSAQSTPQRRSDYVSSSDHRREGAREHRDAGREERERERKYSSSKHYSSARSKYHVNDDGYDRSFEYLPPYEQYEPQPPAYSGQRHQSYRETRADHRYHDQVPIYTTHDSQPRQRRSSHTTSRPTTQTQPPPRRPTTASKEMPKATEDDARRAGIPAGYSYKNWDPTEEPILLLGSVFDANSLGKWIYDWTVFFYGPATPMSEVAGELWLLLIQLAHKVKRAEDCMPRIRTTSNRDLVDDFLESGERLWQRFNKLLKICENFMWKAAKKESGAAKAAKVTMGKNAGCAFVNAIFGRDCELERTEKLMTGIRIWSMRFDANCEQILRHPSA